jgi:glutamate-1-semialdehyde 2,1-aminomutase
MFGGAKEIMKVFDPSTGPKVPSSGTFSANPITLTAGFNSLNKLNKETYEQIDSRAQAVENHLNKISKQFGFPVRMTRAGSVFNLHFVENEISQYFDLRTENKKMKNDFYLSMYNQGIMMAARGMCCTSTPMNNKDISIFNDSMDKSLAILQGDIA